MHPPNKALQLEWCYMSFHSEDRAKYFKSGQRLSNKMLKSVPEFFKNIFKSQVADGSLAKKRNHQIEQCVRRKMRHELCKWYDEKVCRVTERCRRDGCHSRQGNKYYRNNYKWQDRSTVVVVITTISMKRNGRTGPLLIVATRHSSHALCMGQRASTPPRSATRTQEQQTSSPRQKTSIQGASQQHPLHK